MSKTPHTHYLCMFARHGNLFYHSKFIVTTSCKVLRFTFLNLDLSFVPEFPKTGRKGFSMITDLVDYLNNNLLIAHYCGFDISAPLPSYWTFDRFLKQLDNDVLSSIMKSQVLYLSKVPQIRYRHHIHSRGPQTPELP